MPLATSPLLFRGNKFSSRLVLAPLNTGFAKEGKPTAELVRFHRERSGLGIGLSMVGNVSVSMVGRTNSHTAVIQDKTIQSFTDIAKAIRSRGSKAGIQLAHSPVGLDPVQRWRHRDPALEVARLRALISGLSPIEISARLQEFIVGADRSRVCGFDVIQIHAAHGYLLSLLLSTYTNCRRDYFDPNESWLDDFLARLQQAVGGALLSFRLSVQLGIDDARAEEEIASETLFRLAKGGVHLLDLTDGIYTINRHLIYPSASRDRFELKRRFAGDVARGTGALVAFAAGITNPNLLLQPIPNNVLVAIGRPLIADPRFARKLATGSPDTITLCSRSGHCHYFTRNRPNLECGSNPSAQQGG